MSTRQDESAGTGCRGTLAARGGGVARPVTARYATCWGDGAVTVCRGQLVAVELPGEAAPDELPAAGGVEAVDRAALERWVRELEAYFRGERLGWSADEVGLDDLGVGAFQRRVYATLLDVPPAQTISYGALADMAGFPRAARAVGTAMATNPIPVVIPCHRVIRSDGTLGNYGKDPTWKSRLLEHERGHRIEGGDT